MVNNQHKIPSTENPKQNQKSYFSNTQIKNVWRGFHPDYHTGKGVIELLQSNANNIVSALLQLNDFKAQKKYVEKRFRDKEFVKKSIEYLNDWNKLKKNKSEFESVLKDKYSKNFKTIYPGSLMLYLNPKNVEKTLKENSKKNDIAEIKIQAAYITHVAELVLGHIIECMDVIRHKNDDRRSTYPLSYAQECIKKN